MTVALPIFIASLVVFIIHPHLVKIAKMKMIVDNPNARKLNKVPVPVLGGVGVFFGLMFGIGVAGYYTKGMNIQFELIVAMMVMLYTGVGDDILDLSPTTRFALQIFTVCMMMFLCGIYIDNFHGLWGVYKLPLGVAIALTLVSCVGIINSINLIDGVDGLCSGYGMFACRTPCWPFRFSAALFRSCCTTSSATNTRCSSATAVRWCLALSVRSM